tara:strand:- start:3508 stop:4782 length:1275 start_codon:yes stop_codon:yes gene_type:complete
MNKKILNDNISIEYKDRNAERIPQGWEEKKLCEISSFRRGSFPQPYGNPKWYSEKGHPFVQVYDIAENNKLKSSTKLRISDDAASKSVLARKGSLLVSLQGSIGRVAITQYDAYFDRTILIFSNFTSNIDIKYFAIILKKLFEKKNKIADGEIIKTITKDTLKEFKIIIPPLIEQKKITSIINSVDDLINKIQLQINKYQLLKTSLIDDLLYKGIRNKKFKDSPLGKIPENWEIKQLGNFCKLISKKFKNKTSSIKVLSMTKNKGFVESLKYFKKKVFSKDLSNYKIVKRGQFAYSTIHLDEGSIGLMDNFDDGLISPMYTVFETNNEICSNYLLFLLKSEKYIKKYSQLGQGSINRRMSVTFDDFSKLQIPYPPIKEQNKIVSNLNILERNIINIKKKKTKYDLLKKSLIEDLITGGIRVSIN